ncbi:hypothetical protein [Bradyrhizobium sp. NP1]|uniref:hypothetical protein n=1 Tax=Bradyrhizobium sp. NP1 TaxID=3049772 RepID=UPI0025A5E1A6|nr:hypothetical protein [Bradyrhizobium sp. NP1]WJR75941.1 hypothetical protein QOU61_24600 [Bradyrhizobium sp. NP1]
MNWVRERDALIAQTLAFVQGVAGKTDNAARPQDRLAGRGENGGVAAFDAVRSPREVIERARDTPVARAEPLDRRHPIVLSEVKREIQSRIDGFRAHQERFNRERAEYFSATIAKLRAAIDEVQPPRPSRLRDK